MPQAASGLPQQSGSRRSPPSVCALAPRWASSEHPDFEPPRDRVAGRKAAVDDERLTVDVAGIVGGEEQRRARDLDRLTAAPQRIELADTLLLALLAGDVVHRLGHAGLDQARTDGVD